MAAGEEAAQGRRAPAQAVPSALLVFACVLEWAIPGAGYLVLGRIGRAAAALLGVGFLFAWGLMLDGQLDRPQEGSILSFFAALACGGVGIAYFVVTGSDALGRGLGDITSSTYEYGTTFVRAAGLIGLLLVLDVYDIGVGRKG